MRSAPNEVGEVMRDLEATRLRICQVVARNEAVGEPLGSYPLFERATGQLVGTALMKPLPDAHGRLSTEIEVGWHLARAAWGLGYATEAGRALLDRCSTELDDERVFAVVHPDNHRSQAVARRLGMRHIGRTRRYYGEELELFERVLGA